MEENMKKLLIALLAVLMVIVSVSCINDTPEVTAGGGL